MDDTKRYSTDELMDLSLRYRNLCVKARAEYTVLGFIHWLSDPDLDSKPLPVDERCKDTEQSSPQKIDKVQWDVLFDEGDDIANLKKVFVKVNELIDVLNHLQSEIKALKETAVRKTGQPS